MYQAFISYSRQDKAIALRLHEELEFRGLPIWIDLEDIRGGTHWALEIELAITECPFLILLLSPSAVKSEYVKKEYSLAIELNKTIIPVLLQTCEIPDAIAAIQYIDLTHYETGFGKLLKSFPSDAFKKENSLPELFEKLKSRSKKIRMGALTLVGERKIGEAFEEVIIVLQDSDSEIRATAAWVLDKLRDPRAIDPLVNAMADAEFNVRSNAGWALVNLGSPAIASVAEVLHQSKDAEAREMAYQVLYRMGNPAAKQVLKDYRN